MTTDRDLPSEIQPGSPLDDQEIPKSEKAVSWKKSSAKNLNFSESTQFHRGSRSGGVGRGLVAWSLTAATFDALILCSMSCFCVLIFSFLMKVHLSFLLQLFGGSFFGTGILVIPLVLVTYLIMLRTFLGFTFGEWVCGLRMGHLKQRLHRFYSLRVIARTLVIAVTGFVFLPALSLLVGRDIPGWLVDLPLVAQKDHL